MLSHKVDRLTAVPSIPILCLPNQNSHLCAPMNTLNVHERNISDMLVLFASNHRQNKSLGRIVAIVTGITPTRLLVLGKRTSLRKLVDFRVIQPMKVPRRIIGVYQGAKINTRPTQKLGMTCIDVQKSSLHSTHTAIIHPTVSPIKPTPIPP